MSPSHGAVVGGRLLRIVMCVHETRGRREERRGDTSKHLLTQHPSSHHQHQCTESLQNASLFFMRHPHYTYDMVKIVPLCLFELFYVKVKAEKNL